MATERYFVGGGTGNWNSTTNWSATDGGASGASFPITGVNANFTALSGANALNVNVASVCANLVMSASFTGSLTGSSSLGIEGSASFGGTVSHTGTKTFTATAAGNTITSNGVILASAITFNGVSGGWALVDALNTTGIVTLANGSFDDGGFSLTAGKFQSTNSNTRVVTKNANWTLTGNTGSVVTFNGAGITANIDATKSFTLSDNTANAVSFLGTGTGVSWGSLNRTGGSGTFTINGTNTDTFANINLTGYTGQLITTSSFNWTGNLTLGAGSTSFDGSSQWVAKATSGTQIFTSNGVAANHQIVVSTVGATLQFADVLNLGTRSILQNSGTLDLNNLSHSIMGYGSNNSTTRALLMGTGTLTLTGAGAGLPWSIVPGTGMTMSAASSTIKMTDTSSTTKNFSGGGKTYGTVWFAGSGTGIYLIGDNGNTFGTLKLDSAPHTINFAFTQTIATLIGFTGTLGNLITLASVTPGSQFTLNYTGQGIVDLDYISVQDSNVTPLKTWFAGYHSTDAGNNTGWTFPVIVGSDGPFTAKRYGKRPRYWWEDEPDQIPEHIPLVDGIEEIQEEEQALVEVLDDLVAEKLANSSIKILKTYAEILKEQRIAKQIALANQLKQENDSKRLLTNRKKAMLLLLN